MNKERIAKALCFASWHARRMDIRDAIRRKPIVGEMVFEWTTIDTPPYIDKVGVLVSEGEIRTLDGRIAYWQNHQFGLVPEDKI
jgi:hypothetical protein